jgi:hypothetical protein
LRDLKYRPNLFARALITQRSSIVGLAVSGLDNQFYPEVVQRFSEEFAKAGYRLLLLVTHGTAGPDPLLNELLKYRLDALILASSSVSSGLAEACRRAGCRSSCTTTIELRAASLAVAELYRIYDGKLQGMMMLQNMAPTGAISPWVTPAKAQ